MNNIMIDNDKCACKEYEDNRNILLVNINKLKKDSYLDINLSDDAIRVAVLATQDIIVERVTGTCLFKALREMICTGAINELRNSLYYEFVADYLFPIFAYNVPLEVNLPLTYKVRNMGNIQANSETFDTTQLNELKYINQQYRFKVDFYINRAVDFLRCHRQCIPELKCCGTCGCTVSPLNKDYKVGVNLNPVYTNKYYNWRKRGYYV